MAADGEGRGAPRVIVGVTGGIAAYKAVSLVRELVRQGASVTVIPTASALRFVGLPTWEAISRNSVPTDLFDGVSEVRHVALGQRADLVIVAPATAHALASIAGGFAGDLLGTTLLATTAPVLLAPAMHTEMWENPAVVANMDTLVSRGFHVVGPDSGALTGDDRGVGRMAEPSEIAYRGLALLRSGELSGKRVLISAGGTREALDPVRFIGNRSTGAMGAAIAKSALRRGAEVVLVHAYLEVALPAGVTGIEVGSAREMREAMLAQAPTADIIVMAAAVADWMPAEPADEKLTKAALGDTWAPVLIQAPDILQEIGASKRPDQLVVGFAAETSGNPDEREARALAKLSAKNADVLVLNEVGDGVGFGPVDTAVTLFFAASPQSLSFDGTKTSVAERLMEVLQDR
jgi:phosphopantothenoylcysteine decarboxylase / phosphopantothenate---cysteine ligase